MKTCFFDLDGTLTDPGEGITNSVIYALSTYGIVERDAEKLYPFIGPPLADSFKKYYGFSDARAQEAIGRFRIYFQDRGIFENKLYDGVPQLLSALKEKGIRVVLATSKPELFAVRILEHFGLKDFFDLVCGATFDEKGRVDKDQVLSHALCLSGASAEDSCMIGDRKYDILAGKALGMKTVGVLYGYGSREELSEAGADLLCESVAALQKELLP